MGKPRYQGIKRNIKKERGDNLARLNNYYKVRGLQRDWKACDDCLYAHCMPDCTGYHDNQTGRERNIQKEDARHSA